MPKPPGLLADLRLDQEEPFCLDVVRQLTEADLRAATEVKADSQPGTIQRLRESHHSLARHLAAGKTQAEAALLTGRSQQGVGLLAKSPLFKELIQYYRAQFSQSYEDLHVEMAEIGVTALRLVRDRMEEKPDSIPTGELRKVAEFTLDRTLTKADAPKAQGGVSINVSFVPGEKEPPKPIVDLEAEDVR